MSEQSASRPPGSYGPPLIGAVRDTFGFLFNWEAFFRKRIEKYRSPVFKVRIFQPVVAVTDREFIVPLFGDPDLVQDFGFGLVAPPDSLVGHTMPFIFASGKEHDRYKALWIDLIRDRASAVGPVFDDVADSFFARWAERGSFAWADELEDFAVTFVFRLFLNATPDVKDVREIYYHIFDHIAPWFARMNPYSVYSRSVRAYPRLVEHIRLSPRFPEILTRASAYDIYEHDVLAKQLAFLLGMNAFLGIQSLLKSLVGELSLHDGVRRELAQELEAVECPEAIARSVLLDRVIREVLRLHPPVFTVFGRATRARRLASPSGTFDVKAGELVMGVIALVQHDPAVCPEPWTFNPSRFSDPAVNRLLVWPRGPHDAAPSPTDRTCPGKDVAILVAKLFCARLVARHRWRLAETPRWSRTRMSVHVAAPKGPLKVKAFGRAPGGPKLPATRDG